MDSGRFAVALLFLFLFSFATGSLSERLIRMPSGDRGASVYSGVLSSRKNELFCESWKFSIETNDVGVWYVVPEKCVSFVQEYMNGERYRSDSEVIADYALKHARTVNIAGDGKDAWIFDIDETLLSNMPYYVNHGYGSEVFDENSFNEWVDLAEAPALPASLRLYTELQQLGFKIFLLTGRSEDQRKSTDKNLQYAGFTNYEKLILRGTSDLGKPATLYKSEKRQELKDDGYRIHGSSGDQWSDLLGFAIGKRSFKLPNPLYYIA
ncbi:acid phosphatase 1-like [Cynara cardunculus var. scolymus]|uniref:Acid phosphatase (Class B) n=1 Tax=Cynara cardunculus var. scolymus TaxID=59895 RepID=A0A124SCI1_CYNCS|nr:acid phosphatase 1-like [Cynara cardunculus var. scolymus]KVH93852.1 Acid phosphatase (Class B) [Cynara cardunculus var. scolymus]